MEKKEGNKKENNNKRLSKITWIGIILVALIATIILLQLDYGGNKSIYIVYNKSHVDSNKYISGLDKKIITSYDEFKEIENKISEIVDVSASNLKEIKKITKSDFTKNNFVIAFVNPKFDVQYSTYYNNRQENIKYVVALKRYKWNTLDVGGKVEIMFIPVPKNIELEIVEGIDIY